MRTPTEQTARRLAEAGQQPLYLLTIHWPEGPVHYGHRPARLTDADLLPTLIEAGRLESRPSEGLAPESARWLPARRSLSLALALDDGGAPSLRERLAATDPVGLALDWGLLFLDEADPPALADRLTLFHGRLREWRQKPGCMECRALDFFNAALEDRRFGRILDPDMLPEENAPLEGRVLPWVLGPAGRVGLPLWRQGPAMHLAREVAPEDTRIYLDASSEVLPFSGLVQLGDEVIEVTDADLAEGTLGTESAPLLRTEPALHPIGSECRLLPEGGPEWLVAEHPCHAVQLPRDESGARLGEELGCEVIEREEQGRRLTLLRCARWPVRPRHLAATRLRRLRARELPGLWEVADGHDYILHSEKAIDGLHDTTAAEFNASNIYARLLFKGALADGLRRYGRAARVVLRLWVGADRVWDPTSRFFCVAARTGGPMAIADLPYPSDEEWSRLTETPPLPAAGQHPEGDLDALIYYGPVAMDVDISAALEGEDAWAALDGATGEGFRLDLQASAAAGDAVRFFLADVELRIYYQPRTATPFDHELSAEVQGYPHETPWGPMALFRPPDMLRALLTDPVAGLGIDAERIDEDSFDEALLRMTEADYSFARRLNRPEPMAGMLARLLFESRSRLVDAGGRLRWLYLPGAGEWPAEAATLDGSTILAEADRGLRGGAESEAPLDALVLRYAREFTHATASEADGQRFWVERPAAPPARHRAGRVLRDTLDWHQPGRQYSVRDLARNLLERHGWPGPAFSLPLSPPAGALLEPGDLLILDDPALPPRRALATVEAVDVPAPDRFELRGRLAPGGAEPALRLDARHFLLRRNLEGLLEWVLDGQRVATLDDAGNLSLAGRLSEEAALPATPAAESVAWDAAAGCLYLAAAGAPPCLALDTAGDLALDGSLREEAPALPLLLEDFCHAEPGWFGMGLPGQAPLLLYDVAARRLELRGRLREGASFPTWSE